MTIFLLCISQLFLCVLSRMGVLHFLLVCFCLYAHTCERMIEDGVQCRCFFLSHCPPFFLAYVFMCRVYVYVFECGHMSVRVCIYVCTCLWIPEADVMSSLTTVFLTRTGRVYSLNPKLTSWAGLASNRLEIQAHHQALLALMQALKG